MNNKYIYELTNPQRSIWLTEQFYSGTNINNIVGYLKIKKNCNFKAIEKAFNTLISNNDSFRTKIFLDGDIPKQYFDSYNYQSIEILDIKNDKELSEFEASFPKETIPVLNNFLFKTKLLRFTDGSGILVLSTHHLISDAWTISLCIEEIYQNYINIVKNNTINSSEKPSYKDFIESQNKYLESNKFEKDKEFWDKNFENLPSIISFKKGATNVSINAKRKVFSFNKHLMKKINTFCKKNNISDYIFFMSIFGIYFRNIFNTDRFILGNPILNRSNFAEKNMTGMFISIMPFIININDQNSFVQFCQTVGNEQKTMYRHIKYPYHEILNTVRKNHNFSDNLYDIIFSYQNATTHSYSKWLHNGSQAESLQIHIKSSTNNDESLDINYDYLTDIFSENDIELMHNRIIYMIYYFLNKPETKVSEIQILLNSEVKTLLKKFNKTKTRYHKKSTIVKEFERCVQIHPNNIAVIDSDISLTYRELNNKANHLAHKIKEQNISSDVIAFALTRTSNILVTILAILKSGHTYMPIDPDYPIDRINFMLENSNSELLITTNNLLNKITYKKSIIDYNNLTFEGQYSNLNLPIKPNKNAYIIYTSGSTGTPKAVTIKHYNVLNFVKSMQQRLNYKPTKNNKVLSVTTVCFDIFVFEVFATILSGVTLVIADELQAKSPKLLSEVIEKHKISKILTTPSRIELLFSDSTYSKSLCNIKEFILGGEPLPKTLLSLLQENTNAKIYNLYGPTETTVYSTFKDMTNEENITIGNPINNTQIYILNSNNKLQPIGVTGEICIGGDGVGAGYYNNPEKTSEVFIPNPYNKGMLYKTGDIGYWTENGELICLGRKDHQIKIRGYRIELSDISNNILTYEGIEQCVVIDKTDENNKKYLCAYFVAKSQIDTTKLKKYLINILPNYMIPTYFVQIDKIPLTINHKIDRKALPEPTQDNLSTNNEYVNPNTDTEKKLCDLFKNTLKLDKIGITNDIFDYNIDSLEIIKIQTQMLDYNYKINTQDFYRCRTIEKLAKLIDNNLENSSTEFDVNYLSNLNNSFNKHQDTINFEKQNYKNILLIGSTGYLGIHTLYEFIKTTSSHITCIVRNKKDEQPVERLKNLYSFYFNEEIDETRVTILGSDITKPLLGLEKSTYDNLLNSIDLVINSAANVKYYGNYEDFKKINVDVVSNLIDFSMINKTQFVHISTLGVSGNFLVNHEKNYNDFTENDFFIGQKFDENVYIQTKFEAEELIYNKISEGLNCSIMRVGNLTGRFEDGFFQQNIEENAFYNILRMILNYKIVPNTSINQFLEFTPVDYCAKSIVELVSNVQINKYVFHLFNDNYITVSELLTLFENIGFKTDILSGNEFKNKIVELSNTHKNENILKGIVNDLDDNLGLSFISTVNQKNTYTNNCLEKLDFYWPKIDNLYIEKIITYMKKNNYI